MDIFDLADNDNYAIRIASEYGQTEVVKLLLTSSRVDPTAGTNFAITFASEYGHADVVKLLLDDGRADPTTRNNYPIKWATQNGHDAVVKLLLADKRVIDSIINSGDEKLLAILPKELRDIFIF